MDPIGYFSQNRLITRYFRFTSSQLRQKISQQLHLHPQLDQFVVPFLLFADRAFARSAFRLRNIAVGDQPLFAVLATNKPFDLFFAQSETGTDLPVRFSRGFSPEHFLTERLYFCILSGHDNTSCCSFYSTTEGAFFTARLGGIVQSACIRIVFNCSDLVRLCQPPQRKIRCLRVPKSPSTIPPKLLFGCPIF